MTPPTPLTPQETLHESLQKLEVELQQFLESSRRLAESNQRLADATLGQTQAINRLASSHERLLPAYERLARDIADLKDARELDTPKLDLALGRVSTDLALILDNIRHAQSDVRELQRDVTDSHIRLPAIEPQLPTAARLVDWLEGKKLATKVLIALLLLAFGLGGFGHLIFSLFTGG
jgi:chromosome segregation ATPase